MEDETSVVRTVDLASTDAKSSLSVNTDIIEITKDSKKEQAKKKKLQPAMKALKN